MDSLEKSSGFQKSEFTDVEKVDLGVYVQVNADEYEAHIRGLPDFEMITLGINSRNLAEENRKLYTSADQLACSVLDDELDLDTLISSLCQMPNGLAVRGYLMLSKLFGEENWLAIRELLDCAEQVPPRIEVVSDYFLAPWDWLYGVQPKDWSTPVPLEEIMEPFWAVSSIISRQPARKTKALAKRPRRRDYRRKPKVAVIIDETLVHAPQERELFLQLDRDDRIEMHEFDEWKVVSDKQAISSFNEFLLDGDFDIIHFACHAESGDSSGTGIIDDDNPDYGPFIRVWDGRKYYLDYLAWEPSIVELNNPIIFFNACTTRSRTPSNTFSFVEELWSRGAQHIIAIESLISSRIAQECARLFYERFVVTGLSIGLSLDQARRELLSRKASCKDTLSIFYALYAAHHIRLGSREMKGKR